MVTLADATMAFGHAFDAWLKRASVANGGESVARLRLLNELHCNGPRKMADLADTLGVTPRNITALVDALEADDQVRRVAHPTDRRITIVEITGGAAIVEAQFDALRDAISKLFADVPEPDRLAFARTLAALEGRIDPREAR
jgi:DNA-binding MarR family transcriptional regulator